MAPETPVFNRTWKAAAAGLHYARKRLAEAESTDARQEACDLLLEAERACTALVHGQLAATLELEPVRQPKLVLALDVDGVLEDEQDGFSSTTLAGAAGVPQEGVPLKVRRGFFTETLKKPLGIKAARWTNRVNC